MDASGKKAEWLVALAGNPNSGKTTVFNALTGTRQHTGNYPGVTVEKKEGICRIDGRTLRIVDLPGVYSLTAYSMEELVARRFLLQEKPDVVVDVVDASNLERHLYLAVQLMEMKVPLVLAFNMSDVARQRGLEFDLEQLSALLGAPIVPLVATKGEGIDELKKTIVRCAEQVLPVPAEIRYGPELEEAIGKIESVLDEDHPLIRSYGRRWTALKLLEGDSEIQEQIRSPQVSDVLHQVRQHLTAVFKESPEVLIAERRYGFISGACQETVRQTVLKRQDFSDRMDAVLTHRYAGLPIFAVLMYIVFYLTFQVGAWPQGWLEDGFTYLAQLIGRFWPEGVSGEIKSLLIDGVIAGVGGVVVFLPNILLLFLGIAFLEDSGYMARAAFIMDRLMHRIGLHGKSFIPMLIGFGCSVPAIMATRILEERRTRLATMLVIPLMSCGARITIYGLLIPAFFPAPLRGPMMWLIYLIGIGLAIVCVRLLRSTLLKGESVPFVMELPPYRLPTLRGLLLHMWDRGWLYLRKAGTVILALSVVMWAATRYPRPPKDILPAGESQQRRLELDYSLAGRIGKWMEPAIRPLGFDWKIGTAMIGAAMAKEMFVSQMSIVYSISGEEDLERLREHIRRDYSTLQGFCVMLFCLISTPCVATVAVTRRESGAWKWALLQFGGLTALAYLVTLLVYQGGRLVSFLTA
ncbi:MAG TPA: ferrous iron transport protein B [Anaerohalosphaeraceae bacterium]|nr:ferrous iron transport protein B [Anaerohalosphaeraceae bacterium]HOL87868.1 ferrous iron transport protein B [Anaerohalosphaeraceae bacterium]HPP55223.1 ferrous iron transport protein B [Anaerohalosphaeraceae bacterium]